MTKTLYLLFVLSMLAGCSNKQLYGMGQDYQKSKCLKEATTAEQHEKCFNAKRVSFEEYEEQRKKITDK